VPIGTPGISPKNLSLLNASPFPVPNAEPSRVRQPRVCGVSSLLSVLPLRGGPPPPLKQTVWRPSRARVRRPRTRVGLKSLPSIVRFRPANDRETSRNDGKNPQVRNRIRPSPQVAKSVPRTLSRWRHGFKPRWDYQGKRVTEPPREPKVVTVQVTLCASSEIVRHTQVASVHVVRRENRLVGTRFPLKSRMYPGRRSPSEKSSRTM
jgi:hypothetical protein